MRAGGLLREGADSARRGGSVVWQFSPLACKVEEDAAADVLAPFGGEQKCRAVGGETHEEADKVLASKTLTKLKEMALDVAEQMNESEAISWSSSGRSSLKTSVSLWLQAADLLNLLVPWTPKGEGGTLLDLRYEDKSEGGLRKCVAFPIDFFC